MSEVKVKITADNQTRTGYQQAIGDARKFGQEASRAASASASGGPDGGGLRRAFRGLGTDLAAASSPAEAFQAVATRVAEAFGKVTAVVGGFAVGQIIAGQFTKLSNGVAASTKSLQEFSSNYQAVATATTLDAAIAGFDRLQSSVEAAKSNLAGLQSDLGAVIANALTGGAAFAEMGAAIKAMGDASASALAGSTALQLKQAEERAAAQQSGGADAVSQLELQQRREREIAALEERLAGANTPNQKLFIQNAIEETQQRFAVEDRQGLAAAQQAAQAAAIKTRGLGATPEQQLEQERQKMQELQKEQAKFRRAAALATFAPDAASLGGMNDEATRYYEIQQEIEASKQRQFQLDQQLKNQAEAKAKAAEREAEQRAQAAKNASQSLESAIEQREFAGLSPAEQQAKLEADQAALIAGLESGEISPADAAQRALELANRQQSLDGGGATGSFGASSLQRIGFASNEFFDTRQKKDPAEATERATAIIREIFNILKKGEPLVLPSTN